MGLFDKVLGNRSDADKLTEAEGMVGIALRAVAADGVITEEAAGLGTTLSRMNLFAGMGDRDVNKVFEKLIRIVRRQGVDQLMILSSNAISSTLKPTAFAIATDFLMADGHVAPEEKSF